MQDEIDARDGPAQPDVSVIIIAWNVADELGECLQSVRDHAGDLAVEVLLVDNGSTDDTVAFVTAQFPEVEIIRRPTNEGLPARNHGLRRARGRHRMFLDSDARLTAGSLETLVGVLDAEPSVGLVGPKLIYPDGELQLSTRRYPPLLLPVLRRPPFGRFFDDGAIVRHHLMAGEPHDRRRRVEYVLGACQLFRAEAQAAAGEIDEALWFGPDDADWCFTIRRAGFDVLFVPEAEVVHDYRRTSASKPLSKMAWRHLVGHLHFQRKWWKQRRTLVAEGRAFDHEATSC